MTATATSTRPTPVFSFQPSTTFCPIQSPPSSTLSTPCPEPLVRPVALRYEARVDRADPRGTHFLEDTPVPRKLPRPRAHLRSRSYGDADLRPRAPSDGPQTLAPEVLRPPCYRSISPASNISFGSAVTGEIDRHISSGSSDWFDVDGASARAHLTAAVASATGRDSPAISDLSDVRAQRSGGSGGWGRRGTTRTLSLAQGETGSVQLGRENCLSHGNLKYARCGCGNVRYAGASAQLHREFARSLPRACACGEEAPPLTRSNVPMGVVFPAKQPSPDRRILRFIKRRLNWTTKKRQ